MPWSEFEESYCTLFKKFNKRGRRPIILRVALGSMIIQEKLSKNILTELNKAIVK